MTQYGFNLNESVTFVTEIRNLPIKQFKPNNSPSVGREWEIWLEEIEREFQYFKIDTPTDKKDAMLLFGGKDIAYLDKYLPDPGGILDEYQKLRKKLNAYFLIRRNKYLARYLFLKRRPRTGELTVAYVIRLRNKRT